MLDNMNCEMSLLIPPLAVLPAIPLPVFNTHKVTQTFKKICSQFSFGQWK